MGPGRQLDRAAPDPSCNSTYAGVMSLLRPVFRRAPPNSSTGWVTGVVGSVWRVHGAMSGDYPTQRFQAAAHGAPSPSAIPGHRPSGALPSRSDTQTVVRVPVVLIPPDKVCSPGSRAHPPTPVFCGPPSGSAHPTRLEPAYAGLLRTPFRVGSPDALGLCAVYPRSSHHARPGPASARAQVPVEARPPTYLVRV